MLSLAIVGLMVGLMIGRLTTPDERELQQVQATQDGLELWFNEEPKLHGENVEGTVALLFQAQGKAQQGQLSLDGTFQSGHNPPNHYVGSVADWSWIRGRADNCRG